jgi:hypothetical protein
MEFLTESKEELPTSHSSRVGPVENICNHERVGNILTVYLGAVLQVDWDAFFAWVYDHREDYEYPVNDADNPIIIAPPNIIEVSLKMLTIKLNENAPRTCIGARARMT